MDSLTDLAYLLSESFYNWNILIIAVTCFIAPNFVFCQILYRKNIQPFLYTHFWRIKIPNFLKFEEVDNIFKFVYTLVLYIVFLLPNLVLNAPTFVFSIVWFCFGLLLFATKAFAVCKVANFWVRFWTWDESHDRYFEGKIVVDILNESIYTEILYETLPQIVLQVINNMLVEQWTLISIISTIISGIDMINGVYRFIFYKVYRKINLLDIPVKLEFGGITLIDEEAFRENEERHKRKHADVEMTTIMNPMFGDDKDVSESTISTTKDKSMALRLKQLEISFDRRLKECERLRQKDKQESERLRQKYLEESDQRIKESERLRQKDQQESERLRQKYLEESDQRIKESERLRQKDKQESERRVELLENEVESLRKLVLQIMGEENQMEENNESTLPAPWIACVDENEETYYYNTETQVTQWEKPF